MGNNSLNTRFYQTGFLSNFINDFCVRCGDVDTWSLSESLTGSGSTFDKVLIINGSAVISFVLL